MRYKGLITSKTGSNKQGRKEDAALLKTALDLKANAVLTSTYFMLSNTRSQPTVSIVLALTALYNQLCGPYRLMVYKSLYTCGVGLYILKLMNEK